MDINIYADDGSEPIALQAYVTMKVDEDKSATNRFGTFTMSYDLRNELQIPRNGANLPANSLFEKDILMLTWQYYKYS